MDRQEFLDRINNHIARTGIGAVSDRQLSDWLDEKLVDAPEQHGIGRGTSREWDWRHIRQALEIIKAKVSGPPRTRLLRIVCWMRGREFPFEIIHEDVKHEFDRIWRLQYAKTNSLSYDPRYTDAPKPGEIRSTGKAVGKLDRRLAPENVEPTDADNMNFFAMLRFGIENSEQMLDYGKRLNPNFDQLKLEDIQVLNATAAGLFGHPCEISGSGIDSIDSSSETDFRLARNLFKRSMQMMSLSRRGLEIIIKKSGTANQQFSDLLSQLQVSELAFRQSSWKLLMLVANLIAIQKDRPSMVQILSDRKTAIDIGNKIINARLDS